MRRWLSGVLCALILLTNSNLASAATVALPMDDAGGPGGGSSTAAVGAAAGAALVTWLTQVFARPLPENPPLPQTLDDLNQWQDIRDPRAKEKGHETYQHPNTGDIIHVDRATPGAPGWRGQDHYHWENPDKTGKHDQYLDKNGNPVPKGSDKSHIPFETSH